MAAVDLVAASVRPLNGAIVRRYPAASTNVTIGDAVYVKGDGTIDIADLDDVDQSQARGIVVAIGAFGKTTAAVGDVCDVVTHGPVELANATAMTEGAVVYVGNSGAIDQSASATAGDFNYIIGYAEDTTVLYVQGQMIIPTAVPE